MTKVAKIGTVSGNQYYSLPDVLNPFIYTGYVMPRTITVYRTVQLECPLQLVTDKVECWEEIEVHHVNDRVR